MSRGSLSPVRARPITADRAKLISEYSLTRVLDASRGDLKGPSLEDEVHADLSREHAPQHGGFMVRLDVVMHRVVPRLPLEGERSGITIAGTGAGIVYTEGLTLIEALRPASRVVTLGARVIPLRGPTNLPRMDVAGLAYWMGEDPGVDVTDADPTLSTVSIPYRTVVFTLAASRQLSTFASPYVDAITREQLAATLWSAVDNAAIQGTGTGNQPTGILSTANVGSVALGANGAAPTYANLLDLEYTAAVANADGPGVSYLSTPKARRTLAATPQNGVGSEFSWEGDTINDRAALVSSNVPSTLTKGTGTNLHAILCGDFTQVVVGHWGALEIVVDPYGRKKRGMVEYTGYLQCGVAIRHPQAFATITDAIV